jgi:hypothetical protein
VSRRCPGDGERQISLMIIISVIIARGCYAGDVRRRQGSRNSRRHVARKRRGKAPIDAARKREEIRLARELDRAMRSKNERGFSEALRKAGILEESQEWKNAWKAYRAYWSWSSASYEQLATAGFALPWETYPANSKLAAPRRSPHASVALGFASSPFPYALTRRRSFSSARLGHVATRP